MVTDQERWQTLFDKVYVVSLETSQDRRDYVSAHLAEVGLGHFEFHNACDPEHADVKTLFEAGKVAQYPPCFAVASSPAAATTATTC